jgi:hypothetical protein
MDFNLILFEGTDLIKFGMTSEEIQSILKVKPTLFKKSVVDLYDTEDYHSTCHVYYESGENGKLVCAEIEILNPSKVFLDNIQLMGEPRKKVEGLFKSKFEDYSTTDDRSNKYEIGFFAPVLPRKISIVESVAIARKGYGEQQRKFYEKAYAEKYAMGNSNAREYICLNCKAIVSSETPIVKCSKCDVFMIPK